MSEYAHMATRLGASLSVQQKKGRIVPLNRGGVVCLTDAGPIQYGSPPETIKDTMRMVFKVPAVFVVPRKMYRPEWGVSMAELEFPVYFNFFVLKRKTVILCEESHVERLRRVLIESVFGPEEIDLTADIPRDMKLSGLPDLKREMDYFRKNPFKAGQPMQLEDLVEIMETRPGRDLRIDMEKIYPPPDISIAGMDRNGGRRAVRTVHVRLDEDRIRIRDASGEVVIREADIAPRETWTAARGKTFEPPLFGVTCLGASHGFDPLAPCSGLLIWINHAGIMVDPPVHSTRVLESFHINPKHVQGLLLTHCHADHDAGVLQKCFQEHKITLYTTPTIFKSFIRKASALTDLPPDRLYDLFDFRPLMLGQPNRFAGAELWCSYSLHSIPTMGFQIFFEGASIGYSSDTLYDPAVIQKMHEQGVLSRDRRDWILNYPWHYDLIFHEAGVPPLHTPSRVLAQLPNDVKKRLYLVHTDLRDIPPGSGLKRAEMGVENTILLPVHESYRTEAVKTLDALARIDLFSNFPIEKAKEFLSMARVESYKAGKPIYLRQAKGDVGKEKFYIVLSGQAEVRASRRKKIYDSYDYFGEASILLKQPRYADVYARTDCKLLTLSSHDLIHFIRGSNVGARLRRLVQIRSTGSWELLADSRIFSSLTATQKTQLESILEPWEYESDTVLIRAGAVPAHAHIIRSGVVRVKRGNAVVDRQQRGDFVGDARSLLNRTPTKYQFECQTFVETYRAEGGELLDFLNKNPGVQYRLLDMDYVLTGRRSSSPKHARQPV